MLLPRVEGVGPGVEASGFQVDPSSDRLMSIQPLDIVMTHVPSPWGLLLLASAVTVPNLAGAISKDRDLVWIVRAPLRTVVAGLRDQATIPNDWHPPATVRRRLRSGWPQAEAFHAV